MSTSSRSASPHARTVLITGASRGLGRGIARALGEAGATVYLTARTSRAYAPPEPGTVEHVAEEVTRLGGNGIPIRCDHAVDEEIRALFERIAEEAGRLDVLVNNAYSGVADLARNIQRRFWEIEPDYWDTLNQVGLRSHYIASVYAARLMTRQRSGLIVNISSFGAMSYLLSTAYGVGKAALDRMTLDMADELRSSGVAVVSLWPGLIDTELVSSLMDDAKPIYRRLYEAYRETPLLSGRAVAALAADPRIMKKTGRALVSAELAEEYGFTEEDGTRPWSPTSYRRLVKAVLPARWQSLSRLVPPGRLPRRMVRRVLRWYSRILREAGGFRQ